MAGERACRGGRGGAQAALDSARYRSSLPQDQRLYVRQALFSPSWRPGTIRDADRHDRHARPSPPSSAPAATPTSMERGFAHGGTCRCWRRTSRTALTRERLGQAVEPMATDPGGAKAALDRITIPQDALGSYRRNSIAHDLP